MDNIFYYWMLVRILESIMRSTIENMPSELNIPSKISEYIIEYFFRNIFLCIIEYPSNFPSNIYYLFNLMHHRFHLILYVYPSYRRMHYRIIKRYSISTNDSIHDPIHDTKSSVKRFSLI